jgi:hypothetical protein
MILETIVILVLMVVDFPFTVTPATVWGLSLGIDVAQLLLLYLLATIIGGLIFYPSMKKQGKKFRTWKVINKYKSKGTFFSVFVANMLAHNFDTYAAIADHKLNIFIATIALLVSNAIYFLTVWGMIVLISNLFNNFVADIIVSTIVVSVVWTSLAHYTFHKIGLGW